ncbi:MAG: DNA translocase FtsK 4TM domain-containing protein [Chitinophagaceae bacterium]|nr:DNA translocase FtsK 4TM domain-containing protein [Chitinophagaceae bacterium]
MANRIKSSKSQKSYPGTLKPEKEERVSVKELVKDERTHKIVGVLLLLACVFLFTSFTSYLFTWEEDQSAVRNGSLFFPGENSKIANILGMFGAWVSHQFFYNGFGLPSYLFCILLFTGGANIFTGRKVFSFKRHLRYVIAGVVYFSVLLAFIGQNGAFPWGGAFGNMCVGWLHSFLGTFGTAALLFGVGLAYIIWRFNPAFKLPKKDKQKEFIPIDQPIVEELIEKPKKNGLKKEGNRLVPPKQIEEEAPLDFKLVEKEPEEENFPPLDPITAAGMNVVDEPKAEPALPESKKSKKNVPEPELVINESQEEEEESDEPVVPIDSEPYEPTLDLRDYRYPALDLLEAHGSERIIQDPNELEANKNQIIATLRNYDINIQKISATVGPTVTLYEIVPAAGVRISRIKNLEDDIALSLAALGIRIIAPIPGKGTIGIEVPNVKKTIVSMRTLLASDKFQHNNYSLPIAIGKKIDNENFIVDLTTMPHLLMAGATGQGKSVGVNAILVSLLYKKHPSQLKLVLVDPKKVELSLYRTIEKHFLAKLPGEEEAIITDTKKVINTLNALCIEMDNRYDLLKEAGARNIREYNEKFVKRRLNPQKGHQFLPFIVLIIDEFADLIMTAGKEIEMPIARLAQLARAVGIHLVIATQRPSVNIITGTIKANFPARIAFKVSSKIDSRTILDTGGAEQLIGKGDMLVSYNGEITRLQCAFVDTPEVDKICDFIGDQRGYPQAFYLPEYIDEKDMDGKDFSLLDRDPLFEEAARLIVQNQVGSTSLIQRRMKLGYNRAGRLMDQLEAAGVVGVNQGSKARDVLIKTEAELDNHLKVIL